MNKTIIIINGKPKAGKDTFVDYCSKYAKVISISSVDKIKEMAKIYLGWDGEKTEKARKMLSDLKRVSIEYNDSPSLYMQKEAEKFLESDNEFMFLHIREPKEIEKMKIILNCKTLLIINDNVESIDSNNSDKYVNEYSYDYTIENNGTLDELDKKVETFIKNF